MNDNRKVITGADTRLSYAHVWEPVAINGVGDPKYSVSLIIPKTDTKTVAAIQAAIKAAYEAGADKFKRNGKLIPLSALKTPLRDGDTDPTHGGDPVYAGCWFINTSSKQKPGIVDASVQPILDQSEVYSGCYARVSVTFYAYNTSGNAGIAAGLGNVQKIRDGEPLGGHVSAEAEFTPYGGGASAYGSANPDAAQGADSWAG